MATKTKKLTIVDPEEYGLEVKKATSIESAFAPKIAERKGYAKVYEGLIVEEMSPELIEKCSRLRKDLVKVRTGIATTHTTEKAFYRAAGLFIDAIKNKLTLPITQMEDKLKEIESHYENIEKEKKEKIAQERMMELEAFEKYNTPGLGEMDDETYDDVLVGAKTKFEAKKETERLDQLENKRIEKATEFMEFWEQESYNLRTMTETEFDKFMETLRTGKSDHEKKVKKAQQKKETFFTRSQQLARYEKFISTESLTYQTSEKEFTSILAEAVKREKAHEKEQAKIKAEKERLEKEAEEKKSLHEKRNEELRPFIIYIRDYSALLDSDEKDYQKELAELRVAKYENEKFEFEQKEKAEKERQRLEKIETDRIAKAKKEREAQEAKLKAETEAKEKAEAALVQRKEQEREMEEARLKFEREEREKVEAKQRQAELAPDKQKLIIWVNEMDVQTPELKSKGAEKMSRDIIMKFQGFQKWALGEIGKMK